MASVRKYSCCRSAESSRNVIECRLQKASRLALYREHPSDSCASVSNFDRLNITKVKEVCPVEIGENQAIRNPRPAATWFSGTSAHVDAVDYYDLAPHYQNLALADSEPIDSMLRTNTIQVLVEDLTILG
jgi:hypothetical protein